MKLPPLRAVHYFEAVARLQSFSRAAVELAVSQSAVSHQIRQLEDYLGETLLLRQGRRVSLTGAGEIYLEGVTGGLSQIAQASEQLRGGGEMRVRLALYSSFAVKWLIPRLSGLRQQHPELELELEMVAEDPLLSDRVADCFITVAPQARGYSHDLLYRERLFPVCSRRLWQQVEGNWPVALWQLPLLSIQAIYKEKGEDWRRWAEAGGLVIPPEAHMHHFSHVLLAMEAANWDQGVALINDYMLQPEEGNLIRLPLHPLETGDNFYFVCKRSRLHEPAISRLRQWLWMETQGSLRPRD
ncbi:LysR family transcriptional regulator [Aeromonas schubertii]|uniref:LysR family transcriptional regulator n=1 Tax=Aeromonas schubertii TaxID=652 RepID=A0ABS7V9K8_9GAMM|nr:LysR family transcriptional regulator [Aeromonas schubertii]MBZ6065579.1 LysR family transcriptional regulator [Aeromonas schubertii]QCG46887.1 LysR family transcriptional regulator [Aeromonas schubertii]